VATVTVLDVANWLAAMQADFSRALRAPLDRSTGHLQTNDTCYAENLIAGLSTTDTSDAIRSLAVYNRQYWLRLFAVMQGEYPLVARLMGYWRFNGLVEQYLLRHPPIAPELHLVGQNFPEFVATLYSNDDDNLREIAARSDRDILTTAAQLDRTWSQLFLAPEEPVWQPSAAEATQLMNLRLKPAKRWTLIRQNWPLLQMRHRLADYQDEGSIAAPLPLDEEQWWLLRQVDAGIEQVHLDNLQAELYALVIRYPLGEALARFESSGAGAAQATAQVAAWLQASMEWGLWSAAEN
jgi:Putative DNA-binding domain